MSWRVAKSLLHLRDQVNAKFPNRDRSSDGTIGDASHAARTSDHNPWFTDANGVGVVSAMDITHDPAHGVDSYKLADELKASGDKRIKYVISNSRIWSPSISSMWRQYNGSNPHDHHVHISVKSVPALYDAVDDWNVPMLKGAVAGPKLPVTVEASNDLHEHITATVFSSDDGGGRSFYTGGYLSPNAIYVALPYEFKGVRPHVRVIGPHGDPVVAPVEDVGPWNLNDPYWLKPQGRPQAESGFDLGQTTGGRPRRTNLAGIDLSPALARKVGIDGKGLVNWEFADHRADPPVPPPLPAKVPDVVVPARAEVSKVAPVKRPVPVLPGSTWVANLIRAFVALFRGKS